MQIEHTNVEFICPICHSGEYSPFEIPGEWSEYHEQHMPNEIAFKCNGCSVLFNNPSEFTINRNLLK